MNKKDKVQVRKAFINACLVMASIGCASMIIGALVAMIVKTNYVGVSLFITGIIQCIVAATYPTVAVLIRDAWLKKKS